MEKNKMGEIRIVKKNKKKIKKRKRKVQPFTYKVQMMIYINYATSCATV